MVQLRSISRGKCVCVCFCHGLETLLLRYNECVCGCVYVWKIRAGG